MRRAAGFSLLELVVVLAIFALVALIGAQVLQVTTRSNERLTAVSEESEELARGLALLRSDLGSAVPRGFFPVDGQQHAALVATADGFSVSVGGLAQITPNTTGFGRVEWRFDPFGKTISRLVWTSLTPGAATAPETVVMRGVSGFGVETHGGPSGWSPGFARTDGALPQGMRVTLEHERAGDIAVLVAMP